MELSNLRPAEGSVKQRKRIGRGSGSGRGGTSTRGHKGDKARSGAKVKRHFEGGQTPMQRRLPKRGFKNINRVEYVPINLSTLEALVQKTGTAEFTFDALVSLGVCKASAKVKILGNGKLNTKVNIAAHAVSEAAKRSIESLGGHVEIV
ncbi:MAG TPA: 50S ribosomal protein L15 [Saprospiraceae bacterium]|nr:50S ribosomal protein L15 [Saprospiraceae bacterium]